MPDFNPNDFNDIANKMILEDARTLARARNSQDIPGPMLSRAITLLEDAGEFRAALGLKTEMGRRGTIPRVTLGDNGQPLTPGEWQAKVDSLKLEIAELEDAGKFSEAMRKKTALSHLAHHAPR